MVKYYTNAVILKANCWPHFHWGFDGFVFSCDPVSITIGRQEHYSAIEEQPSTFPAPSDTIVRVALSKPESFRRLAPYQLVYRVQAKAESELAHHYPRRLLLINPFSE